MGVVQASEAELRAALHKVQACLVDGAFPMTSYVLVKLAT